MKRRIGPILHLRQGAADEWRFSVGLWVEPDGGAPPRLRFAAGSGAQVGALQNLGSFGGADWISWDVRIPRTARERRTGYTISGLDGKNLEVAHVVVPAKGQAPRIAFFSCNGVQDPKDWTSPHEMEALWDKMFSRHRRPVAADRSGGPYHVLLGGGDQIYCDSIWTDVPGLRELDTWKKRKKLKPVPAPLAQEIEAHYACLYTRWKESWFGRMQACVPGIYTWDDHDIFDGWGSYEGLQDCDLFGAIFESARRAFELIQLGGGASVSGSPCLDASGAHFLQAFSFDDELDVVVLDLRSQRTPDRVMDEDQWRALYGHLKARAGKPKVAGHLLVVSTIPVVYLNFATSEKFLDWFPWRQDLEDDLRDHWESSFHQEERARLIMALLDHSVATRSRITFLSGDVHVGARGRIVSRRPQHLVGEETEAIVHQLTSSAIVYPPPGALALAGMRAVSAEGPAPLLAVSQVHSEVMPVGAGHFVLGQRNWLSIEPKALDAGRQELWIRWITEKGDIKPPIVVQSR